MAAPLDPGLVAQLVFWAGLLLGLAVGGAIGAWKGLHAGGATACVIIGLIGLGGAGFALSTYWQFWQHPNSAEATVLRIEIPSGPDPVVSLSFTNSKQQFESFYNSARVFLPMIAAAGGTELPFDPALLPTPDAITKHLAPSIAWGVIDADGITSRSRSTVSAQLVVPVVGFGATLGALLGVRHEVR